MNTKPHLNQMAQEFTPMQRQQQQQQQTQQQQFQQQVIAKTVMMQREIGHTLISVTRVIGYFLRYCIHTHFWPSKTSCRQEETKFNLDWIY